MVRFSVASESTRQAAHVAAGVCNVAQSSLREDDGATGPHTRRFMHTTVERHACDERHAYGEDRLDSIDTCIRIRPVSQRKTLFLWRDLRTKQLVAKP